MGFWMEVLFAVAKVIDALIALVLMLGSTETQRA
jgi:hypothetical protein